MEAFGAVGAVVSIGTILSGLKSCYYEIQDMRNAWDHGQKDLQNFSLKVKLLQKAFKQVLVLIESDPKHVNDLRKLGYHILQRLKTFLEKFPEVFPDIEPSRRAKALTKFRWYLQKRTANSLLATISHSEVSLTLWVSIGMVQSRDKRIKALGEEIRELELKNLAVPRLRNLVTQLQNENSELKQKCREKIKEMKALQKEHRAELREQRDYRSVTANTEVMDAVIDRFLSETIEPLIRENAAVLELGRDSQSNSRRYQSSHSTSHLNHLRSRAVSSEDISSRSPARTTNLSTPPEPELQTVPSEHTSAARYQAYAEAVEGDQDHARPERLNVGYDDGDDSTIEVVEEVRARANSSECSSPREANRIVELETLEESTPVEEIIATAEEVYEADSVEIAEAVPEASSLIDDELHEYGREIGHQANEHAENVSRDERASICREQEEAAARLNGRPRGREDARKVHSRKFRRRENLGHNP